MMLRKWLERGFLTLLVILFVGPMTDRASGDVEEGLIAYFKFDEGAGKDLIDLSGAGNDARITGDVEWVDGKYDKGLQFDGKASHADVPPGTVGPFDAATITAWIKVAKMPSTHSYNIAGVTTGPGTGFYLELYKVNLTAWQCGPNMNAGLPYVPTFSEWHHVAAVYTGDEIQVYIDGEQKAKAAGTNLPGVAAMPFRISGDHSEVNQWGGSLDGVIDEVRLYDRALEPDEIKETMKSGTGQAVSSTGKLYTRWAEIKDKY